MIFGLTKRGEKNCRKPETKFIELQLGVENCFGFQKSFVVCFVSKLFQYITCRKKKFLIWIFIRVINLKVFFNVCNNFSIKALLNLILRAQFCPVKFYRKSISLVQICFSKIWTKILKSITKWINVCHCW